MADDNVRDDETNDDAQVLLDQPVGNENSAFLDDEELHDQLPDEADSDARTTLTAAHQGSRATATPADDAAGFTGADDIDLPGTLAAQTSSRGNAATSTAGESALDNATGDPFADLGEVQPLNTDATRQSGRTGDQGGPAGAAEQTPNTVAADRNNAASEQTLDGAAAADPFQTGFAAETELTADGAATPSGGQASPGAAPANAPGDGAGKPQENGDDGSTDQSAAAEQPAPPTEQEEFLDLTPPAAVVAPDVNDGPTTADAAASGAEDAASIAVTLTGADIDGTVDSFALSSLPTDGTLYLDAGLTTPAATGADYAAAGGSLTLYFVPDADYNGVVSFDYAATDDDGATDATPATATITVTDVNDGPTTADAAASGAEDAASIAVTLTGADIDGTVDSFALSSLPTDGTLYLDAGLTTPAATGADYAAAGGSLTLYFVPDADYNGVVSFDYAATDDDGATDATPATATITVTAVYDTFNGTAGDDALTGTWDGDTLNGLGGNDTLDGGGGADIIDGGAGDDVITFDASDIGIDGGTGTDTLQVGSGDIDLSSYAGTISGFEQIDLSSDAGANSLTLSAQDVIDLSDTNTLTITGNAGDSIDVGTDWMDTGVDGSGNQIYVQNVGGDTAILVVDSAVTVNGNIQGGINPINGTQNDDVLAGTEGRDLINAKAGDDDLSGAGGHDNMMGGKGDDTLQGGMGDDTLKGGHGDDTFIFDDSDFGGTAWTDTVDGQGDAGNPASDFDMIDLTGVSQGWVLEVDGQGQVAVSGDNPSQYTNGGDFSGTITFDDGSTVAFESIEKVDW